jgi:hypothetical protein
VNIVVVLRDDLDALWMLEVVQLEVFVNRSVEGEGAQLVVMLCESGRGHRETGNGSNFG